MTPGKKEARMQSRKTILVDTNVWLDLLLDRANARQATRALAAAVERGDTIVTTPTIMKDVFFLIQATLKQIIRKADHEVDDVAAAAVRNDAWACLARMQDLCFVAGVDAEDHSEALRLRDVHDDYEDNLLIAVAKRIKADYLVTNDKGLLSLSASVVNVLTPDDYARLRD